MIVNKNNLFQWLEEHRNIFHPVVQYNPVKEKLIHFDLSKSNRALQKIDTADTDKFCNYINNLLKNADAKFGTGGL